MITTSRQVRVIDEFGSPVSNAHVYISANNGTTTNNQGSAIITGNSYDTVKISYVGKVTETYTLQNLPKEILLRENFESLDEVVITSKPKQSTPGYLFPALGAAALLLVLMSLGGNEPKKVVL